MSNAPRDWLRSYAALPSEKRNEIDALLAADAVATPWRPLVDLDDPRQWTPQKLAYENGADELLYGGSAGGGKTDLLIGLALTCHRRSILFRRVGTMLESIIERMAEILGSRAGLNLVQRRWRLPSDRAVWFGACPNPGDERKYQGQPHDLKAFDELTQFTERQYRYLSGWNRTSAEGQRCRIVAATNPPTDTEGEWVLRRWGAWLDPEHPVPALPGDLRWYAMLDGTDTEVDGPDAFEHKGERIQPKSRSFIPSSVDDNPYYMATGYKATLQALPEPLRSQMLHGDWSTLRQDDPWQVIPSGWIEAAQQRWSDQSGPAPMDALGVDPARGGLDETVLVSRRGNWFGPPSAYPGQATPDGPAVAALALAQVRDGAPILVDAIGIGASVFDFLKSNGLNAVAMVASEASHARDRTGKLGFANKRAEWWWKLREALDPDNGSVLMLPPDRQLKADLAAPKWSLTARGIQLEDKDRIRARLGRSPDRGEALVLAAQAGPKRARPGAGQGPRVEPPKRTDPLARWR